MLNKKIWGCWTCFKNPV